MDGRRRLGPFLFGQARQPVVQPVQFGVSELSDLRVHRGDDGCGRRLLLPLDIGGGLSGDDGADLGDLVWYRSVGQVLAESGDIDQRNPGQAPDGGVHVRWHPEVQYEQQPPGRLCPGRRYLRDGQDGNGGPGGGDQNVSADERGRHVAGLQGPATYRRGHLGGSRRVAAGHGELSHAALAEQPGREPARGPGPEHHRIAACQAAQVRAGEVQASPGERDTFRADRGLGAGPFAGPQRRVDQAGDGGAGGARRGGRPGGPFDLGDNLVFANGHRIQPARDREQMLSGRAADVDAGHPRDVSRRQPATRRDQVRHRPGSWSGGPIDGRVDLHPVAGGQDGHFVDGWQCMQPGQHTAQLRGRHGKFLEDFDRGEPVGHPDIHNRHRRSIRYVNSTRGWMRARHLLAPGPPVCPG